MTEERTLARINSGPPLVRRTNSVRRLPRRYSATTLGSHPQQPDSISRKAREPSCAWRIVMVRLPACLGKSPKVDASSGCVKTGRSHFQRGSKKMATTTTTDARETANLIAREKVEGTAVYGMDGKKIGNVQRVMIDKISGKVAYAVMRFGGFLGMGEDYYPTPWSMLRYDTSLEGYRVNLTKDQLDKAP